MTLIFPLGKQKKNLKKIKKRRKELQPHLEAARSSGGDAQVEPSEEIRGEAKKKIKKYHKNQT